MVVQQKDVPVIQKIIDTVYIVKNENPQHPKPVSAAATIVKTPQQAPVATEQKTLPGTTNNVLPIKEEQPAWAMNKPVPSKVLHLSEMDNENANPRIRNQERPSFFVAFPDRIQSGSSSETFSMLVAQKLNLIKN